MRGRRYIGVAALVGLLLVAVMLWLPQAGPAQAQDVDENPVAKQITYTLYPATAVTTGTVNTSSPAMDAYSRDMSSHYGYAVADVFVTIDGTGTFTLTATPQLSADGSNWASADYEYATDSAIATQAIARTMTADGTEYMRVPLAGEYLRVQMAVTGAITPTVKVTYRN